MNTRRSYARVAARYAFELSGDLAGTPLDRALLDVVADLADGPVLDVGCGPGHVAAYLADRVPAVEVDLTFRFLDPEEETRVLAEAGLAVTARLDRAPDPRVEHRSDRCYLPARAASASGSGS